MIHLLVGGNQGSRHAATRESDFQDDALIGSNGAETISGGGGKDVLIGLYGNDTYYADSDDVIIETLGGGSDTVLVYDDYKLGAGQEIEQLSVVIYGDFKGMTLVGNEFNQTISGGGKDDFIDGQGGADTMRGQAGNDIYIVDNAKDIVSEFEDGGNDTIVTYISFSIQKDTKVENLTLEKTVTKSGLLLKGNGLDNTIVGNNVANVLDGEFGADVLTGGKGSDTFVFSTKLGAEVIKTLPVIGPVLGVANVDRITDFAVEDTIRLSKSVFSALAPGQLKANEFRDIGKGGKVDADDHILYDSRDGSLFYDADGSGKAAAVKFAVLDNKAALTHADFLIA